MNNMEIIGIDKDIKHFKDEIDYEDSQIYLGPSDKEKTYNLWIEPEDLNKKEESKDENKVKKVKFLAIKNTYEYPHETENVKIVKKEGNKRKKEKKIIQDYDDEMTPEEKERLEKIKEERRQRQEMERLKKEKEKEQEEENKIINKEKEEEERKRKERQERNARLVQNKKKKNKKKK